ncbi:MAG TPA: translation initiation factor [Polyangiales bacterium]|nr:translation initiation factor [Polyangiales bacterium]
MGKKNKPTTTVPTSESPKLTHSPFANLGGRPAEPAAKAPEPAATPAQPQARGRLVLRRETKHRGGKPVVIISGFGELRSFDDRAIAELASEFKQRLGCGGTVDGDEIVLQGDRPAEVAELLRAKGFRVAGVTS